MKNIATLFGLLTLMLFQGCIFSSNKVKVNVQKKADSSKVIQTVSIINNQLVVTGKGLEKVTSLKIKNGNLNASFAVESVSSTQIIANAAHSVSIGVGQVFDLILSSAEGSATFAVSFTLENGSVTASKLSSMGAAAGQILKYNGSAWIPSAVTSSQLYMGAWDANTNSPDLTGTTPQSGDYYIVTTAGTTDLGSGAVSYDAGDVVMYNGTSWDKIANSSIAVSSFNGRTGVVVPANNDYTWAQINKASSKLEQIADIDVAGRVDGQVLKWDAGTSKWIVANDDAGSGTPDAGSVTNNEVSATANIAQSKIANLTTDLAAKQPLITAAATTTYFRGDKTFVTLDTSVVPENVNLYFTNARVLGVPLTGYSVGANTALAATDTVLAAFQKIQGQLDAKASSGSLVDWSVTGLETLEPSRLNLTTASRAVVTNGSGVPTASATTATELGYLSGVTSAIQTQLNAKQATIDKTTVQPVSKVRIYGANANNYVELSAATLTANRSLIFPDSNGSNGNVLSTDGSGNLTWIAPTGSISSLNATQISAGNVTNTEFDYLDGVTSSIQTQLSGKEPAITAGTTAQYLRGDKSLSTFASDVLGTVLTGLSTATNAVITATDTTLVAFGKLQKQTTDLDAAKLNTTGGTLTVGTINGVPTPVNADDIVNKAYVDAFGQWTKGTGGNAADLYFNTGKVGVGTTAPTTALDVNGAIRVADDTTICSSTIGGAIRYNSTLGIFENCDGTKWSSASSGVPIPSATVVLMDACPAGWTDTGATGGGPGSASCNGTTCRMCESPASLSAIPASTTLLMEVCPSNWTFLGIATGPGTVGRGNISYPSCQSPVQASVVPQNSRIVMATCPATWVDLGATGTSQALATCGAAACRICEAPSNQITKSRILEGPSGGTTYVGGSVVVVAGAGGSTSGSGGNVFISSGTPIDGAGGIVNIAAASGVTSTATARGGGSINLTSGNGVSGGNGGNLTLSSGGSDTGTVGSILLNPSNTNFVGINTPTPAYNLDVNGKINGTEVCIAGTCRTSWNTASDVLDYVLTGLSTATNAVITATDTILSGMGKLQKQITDLGTSKLNATGGTLSIGTISGVPTPTNADDVANKGYIDSYGHWAKGSGANAADINFSSGNVGIGTATPSYGLDVNGTFRSTSVSTGNMSSSGKVSLGYSSATMTDFSNTALYFNSGSSSYAGIGWAGISAYNSFLGRRVGGDEIIYGTLAGAAVVERVRFSTAGIAVTGKVTTTGDVEVGGTMVGKAATDNTSGTTINFSSGNLQYTTDSCQAYTLTNMRDGGSYTFAVQGTSSATCSFTHAGFTVHMPPDHEATTASKHTIYTFLVMGTHIYVSWIPGL